MPGTHALIGNLKPILNCSIYCITGKNECECLLYCEVGYNYTNLAHKKSFQTNIQFGPMPLNCNNGLCMCIGLITIQFPPSRGLPQSKLSAFDNTLAIRSDLWGNTVARKHLFIDMNYIDGFCVRLGGDFNNMKLFNIN